jgi:glycosyltransferase involved in cell wall biosynthesis
MPQTVCIVSPGNLASNPRVLKEAAALHEAGYGVTAIACDYTEALRPFDDEIAGKVPWTVLRVPRSTGERYFSRGARLVAHAMSGAGFDVPLSVAASAYGGPASALKRAACAVHADLYIAHYIAALPAARTAAQRHGAMLGFDAEDLHSGEGTDGPGERFQVKMVQAIEDACLPRCVHITTSAPLIGAVYAKRYGISPATVLNVFPLAMAQNISNQNRRSSEGGGLRAYWFSQTIGLDRGLQAFVHAMARTRARVTLDVRGSNRWGHGDKLMEVARELGVGDRITLLPIAPPDQMVTLAAPYDIGLSLESDSSESRRLCLTNKIFTYLLAGVPVMMSSTPAQFALAADLGAAALPVALADPDGMARALDRLAASPAALEDARASALRLGRQRYNWDVEKQVLLDSVASAFARHDQACA